MYHEMQQAAKQMQRLILSPQMQQALNLLQMPVMELASLITEEMTQNPLLEWNEEGPPPFVEEVGGKLRVQQSQREDDDFKTFIENTIPYESSLYEVLMAQAKEAFPNPADLQLAHWVIGSLDESGFLTTSLEEIALLARALPQQLVPILSLIQEFEPCGVGARSLQESLLIQLKHQGKVQSLAYRIVEQGFEHMLKNQMAALSKLLQCSPKEIHQIIADEIARLDFHPGKHLPAGHYREMRQEIIPDILIHFINNHLEIEINKSPLPTMRISSHYLDLLYDPQTSLEVKRYLQERFQSSKWLMRNLQERQHTLYRIAEQLIAIQEAYFKEPQGALSPLTMKEVADRLALHESTVTRAVSHKYISCPRGLFLLRDLFTHAYTTTSGESISSNSVKGFLREIIAREEKRAPLSDEAISEMIKQKGVPCARRTVAKYRQELGIGNAAQRKRL